MAVRPAWEAAFFRYLGFIGFTAYYSSTISILIMALVFLTKEPSWILAIVFFGPFFAGAAALIAVPAACVVCLPGWMAGWMIGRGLKMDIVLSALVGAVLSSLIWIVAIKVVAHLMEYPDQLDDSIAYAQPSVSNTLLQLTARFSPVTVFASPYAAWRVYERF